MKETKTPAALLATPPNLCGGAGGHWESPHWDSGHPDYWVACPGCTGCVLSKALANLFAALPHAPAIAAFAALAAVGKAIAAAAAPAAGIAALVAGAKAVWAAPTKGAWYEVTGKRGNAKTHLGVTGECVWVGSYDNYRYGRLQGTTVRVGIKTPGAAEAVFVPASAVTRVPVPEEAKPAIAAKAAAAAEKAARKPAAAGKGDVVRVTHGANAGKTGKVFWVGTGKSGPRFGLDPNLFRKRGKCPDPMWVDATDCELAEVEKPAPVVAKPVAQTEVEIPALPVAAAPVIVKTGCLGKHTKFDGSYWVSDAKGIPVARVCDGCKAAKLKKYRPEIFTNPKYETTEAV